MNPVEFCPQEVQEGSTWVVMGTQTPAIFGSAIGCPAQALWVGWIWGKGHQHKLHMARGTEDISNMGTASVV